MLSIMNLTKLPASFSCYYHLPNHYYLYFLFSLQLCYMCTLLDYEGASAFDNRIAKFRHSDGFPGPLI
jgi:hypothetical protein